MSVRKLGQQFCCGKTQISNIIKNKEAIMELYESNMQSEIICSRKRAHTSEFVDINELAVSRNNHPGVSQLCEKVKQIAEYLGFKASNGWLNRWKRQYNVKRMEIGGESGDMHRETVESWKERLTKLLWVFQRRTFGTLMKQLVFGGLSQIMVLAREDHSAKEVKKQSSELQ